MPLDDFIFHDRVGSGSYSDVFRVTRKVDKKQYVIKQIKLASLNRNEQEMCIKECKILSKFEHPYIVRYYESFLSRDGGGLLNIVMELCASNLGDFLIHRKDRKLYLEEKLVWKLFIQILISLARIHDSRIIHRDVKPMNIFLDSNGNVKIGDFGVSKQLGQQSLVARTLVGTPYYLSPELCKNEPYTAKADVWALGCILYELIELKHPFHANNHAALIMNIVKGTFKPINSRKYSNELAYIVQKCLRKDQQYRYTTTQLLSLSMVQEYGRKLGLYHLFPERSQKKSTGSTSSNSTSSTSSKHRHHRRNIKNVKVVIPPLKIGKGGPSHNQHLSPPSAGRKRAGQGGSVSPSSRKKRSSSISPRKGNHSPGRIKKGNISPNGIVVISPRKKINQMEVLTDKDVLGAPSTISPRKISPQLSPQLKQMISPRKKNGGSSSSSPNQNNHNQNSNKKIKRRIVPSQARIGSIPNRSKGRPGQNSSSPPRRRVKIDPKIRKRNKGGGGKGYQIMDWTKKNRKSSSPLKQRPSKIIIQEDQNEDVKSIIRGPSKTNLMIVSNPFDVVHKPLFSMKRRKVSRREDEKQQGGQGGSQRQQQKKKKNNRMKQKSKSEEEFNVNENNRRRKKSNGRKKNPYQYHKRNKSTGSTDVNIGNQMNDKQQLQQQLQYSHLHHRNQTTLEVPFSDNVSTKRRNSSEKRRISEFSFEVMETSPPKQSRIKFDIHSIQTTPKKRKTSQKKKKSKKKKKKGNRSPIFEVIDEDIVRKRVESEKIATKKKKKKNHIINNEKGNIEDDEFTVHVAKRTIRETNKNEEESILSSSSKKKELDEKQKENVIKKRRNEDHNNMFVVNHNNFIVETEKKSNGGNNNNNNSNNMMFSGNVNSIEDEVNVNHLSTFQFEELNRLGSEFDNLKEKILESGVQSIQFNEIFQFMKDKPRAKDSVISKFILDRIHYEKSHLVDSFHSLVLIDKNRSRILEKL